MPQIANLGVKLIWQFSVIDDNGNTHPLPSEPVQMQEPSEAAFLAAWRRWEAERDGHRANLAAQMLAARGNAERQEQGHAEKPALTGVEE